MAGTATILRWPADCSKLLPLAPSPPIRYLRAAPRRASWRSGDAADCKSVYTGSIPVLASTSLQYRAQPAAPDTKHCDMSGLDRFRRTSLSPVFYRAPIPRHPVTREIGTSIRAQSRSMIVAVPIPPPTQRVARPVPSPLRSIASRSVPRIIAPVAPRGWPMAMLPPSIFVLS